MKKGFTLIELLVVVLIIGILTTIALPQYNKAVRRTHFAAMNVTLNALMKGIDLYILENGFPEYASFLGPTKTVELSVDGSFTGGDRFWAFSKEGAWTASCIPENCTIRLLTSASADGSFDTNNWLNGNDITWQRTSTGNSWKLRSMTPGNASNSELCRWWVPLYGTEGLLEDSFAEYFCNALL